jgi:hypothetical protein
MPEKIRIQSIIAGTAESMAVRRERT